MNSQQIFRRSRLRLAGWFVLVMGSILGLSGLGMARALVQSNWVALEREIESTAGTLHDSLEPMLPPAEASTIDLTEALQQILPDLCVTDRAVIEQPVAELTCDNDPSLIQRHTTGISDRTTYYIRLYDTQGNLLAFSPNQPEPLPFTLNPAIWQTLQADGGSRYRQFTTSLHGAAHTHTPGEAPHEHPPWGHLQVGRTLSAFDAEIQRLRRIAIVSFPLAVGVIALASWGLSGIAMRPIYQAYQQQQQFTANAAHELRSPLASLLATVEAALRLPPEKKEQEPTLLKTVERQGRRLSQLVTDLLLLTSLEQNTTATSSKSCCLTDIVADLAEEFAELAAAKDIHFSSQVPDTEIYAMGHESQLYRLVSNLVANAIQYTHPGGSVILSLQVCDHDAEIVVKDTGIGIPVNEQERIFERFYRVDSDRSRKTGGTGLGLAIAQAIVQRHKGQISLNSEIGKGSTFTLYLQVLP
ncbi:MAG: two-component system sensor histidine kinase RppB [Cyanobacteria bacterium J06632_3]